MASFQCVGFVEGVRVLPDSCILFLSEYKKGYKKSDGTIVDDKYVSWKIIFKGYFIKYITSHFGKGMLVEVKGEVLPYAKDREGNLVDGYTILGKNIDRAAYQRTSTKVEKKIIKDSQIASDEQPDLDAYNQPDF